MVGCVVFGELRGILGQGCWPFVGYELHGLGYRLF